MDENYLLWKNVIIKKLSVILDGVIAENSSKLL